VEQPILCCLLWRQTDYLINKKNFSFTPLIAQMGICSCAGMSILSANSILASTDNIVKNEQDWKIGFIQKRFAKLLKITDSYLDDEVKKIVLESLGRECAKESKSYFENFINNPEGFLTELKKSWIDSAEYNKETQTIKVIGKKTDSCFCPFVDKSITPKEFCTCSLGHNKEVYETILGKTVEVTLDESILRGGERCSFSINFG
jgi:predicted hydrocarbon binding protein